VHDTGILIGIVSSAFEASLEAVVHLSKVTVLAPMLPVTTRGRKAWF